MKQIELTPAYKETLLGSLINTSSEELQKVNNIKISLINNGKVFAIPDHFDVKDFTTKLNEFVTDTLKLKSQVLDEQDLTLVTFYKVFPPMMKKAAVYFVCGKYLYINVIPYKFIEDANYTEGKISEFLTASNTEQLFQFTDSYIFALYPPEIQKTVQTQGRYFEEMGLGVKPLIASYLEPGESLLAKLNIYKVEQSKANALTSAAAKSFYILTTNGSYLFCLDQNLNLKYVESLGNTEMVVKSKIGRDPVICGTTSWLSNRDNDFLYDEIKALNNANKAEKIKHLAILNFNFAESNEETLLASKLLLQYAEESNDGFFIFAAQFLVMKATYHSFDDVDDEVTLKLISLATAAVSDADFYKKTLLLTTDLKIDKNDIAVLMHIFNRTKVAEAQYPVFVKTLIMLKDRYLKLETDTIDLALVEIETARRVLSYGDRQAALKIAQSALSRVSDETFAYLVPDPQYSPSEKYSGAMIGALAYEILFNSTGDPKESENFASLRAIAKPLAGDNVSKLAVISNSPLKNRAEEVLALFDYEKFVSHRIPVEKRKIKNPFSKISESQLKHPAMNKKMPYSDISSWLDKVKAEPFDSITKFGEKVSEANYPALYQATTYCAQFFEMSTPDVYVFKGEKSTGVLGYYAEKPFISVGFNHLDVDSDYYLSPNELYFALARQMANIKAGFCKLETDKLWRDFFNSGAMNIDKLSVSVPTPNFIAKNSSFLYKYRFTSKTFCEYPQIENFDCTDKQTLVGLEKKLSIIHFKPQINDSDQKINEYASLSRLMCHYADRFGLLFSGSIVTAVNALVKTDIDFPEAIELFKTQNISDMATAQDGNGKFLHFDFALRIQALISFYLSDSYSALEKQIFE